MLGGTSRKTIGRGFLIFLSLTVWMHVLTIALASSSVSAQVNPNLELNVKTAVLMDANTGQVVYDLNMNEPRPPASMAKMMTEYIVMEQIKSGQLSWDDMVTISEQAASTGGSGGMLAANETYSVKDLFYAISIYSANDASVALAEKIAGTEENFAKMMNAQAKELGLSKYAYFINATGLNRDSMGTNNLPKDLDGETTLTAHDTALIAFHILKKHEDILEFTSIPEKKFRERDADPMRNWNQMLGNGNSSLAYEGMDGLKTGFTSAAGYCFTGTAERDGIRFISVVMYANEETRTASFVETAKLMDYGFNNFESTTVVAAKAELEALPTVKVNKGVQTQINVVTQESAKFLVKKGEAAEPVITAEPLSAEELTAPIKAGSVVGKATISLAGIEKEVNLVATEDVEKAGWFRLFMRAIKNFFVDLFNNIKNLF